MTTFNLKARHYTTAVRQNLITIDSSVDTINNYDSGDSRHSTRTPYLHFIRGKRGIKLWFSRMKKPVFEHKALLSSSQLEQSTLDFWDGRHRADRNDSAYYDSRHDYDERSTAGDRCPDGVEKLNPYPNRSPGTSVGLPGLSCKQTTVHVENSRFYWTIDYPSRGEKSRKRQNFELPPETIFRRYRQQKRSNRTTVICWGCCE